MFFRKVVMFVMLLGLAGCNMSREGADVAGDDPAGPDGSRLCGDSEIRKEKEVIPDFIRRPEPAGAEGSGFCWLL